MQHQVGELRGILTRPTEGAAVELLSSASMEPGQGIVGDYQTTRTGTKEEAHRVSLISEEAIAAAAADGVSLTHAETRRNLLIRGVDLNELVEREFTIGEVTLRGTGLCHPCSLLEKRTKPGALAAFKMRGGLYATIVKGGAIKLGDSLLT